MTCFNFSRPHEKEVTGRQADKKNLTKMEHNYKGCTWASVHRGVCTHRQAFFHRPPPRFMRKSRSRAGTGKEPSSLVVQACRN